MANVREIRERIKSISDIMKITNAMYLISSSKRKRAKRKLEQTEPYFQKIQSTIQDILLQSPDIKTGFFDKREHKVGDDRKIGYIVVTADKGLAGSYNHNVVKLAEQMLPLPGDEYLYVVGQVGRHYFENKDVKIDGEFHYTAQNPTLYRAGAIAKQMMDLFLAEELDDVRIIYTRMVTPMTYEPEVLNLLPLETKHFVDREDGIRESHNAATFEPSPEEVMHHIVPGYLKGMIYGALVEAFSSEQNARMSAMDAATTNAKEMIRELSLKYNRARQAAITQEITEVASGAKAMQQEN